MDSQEFIRKLNEVEELMGQEHYKEAINIIENLKEIEKISNFNYNLTHRLYQLDSNSQSLYNQQVILKILNELMKLKTSISIQELNQITNKNSALNLGNDVLKREIELLILRNLLTCRIDGDRLIF